jgi:large subunit ribosomal protein L13
MKTRSLTTADITKKWVTVDASGQTLGRIASQIAHILRGKHKAQFTPHLDCGDHVIVTNAAKIRLTGKKISAKMYYNHSGYMGGLKAMSAGEVLQSHPERLITFAVRGMLPKNTLARKILTHLRVYSGNDHPHQGQNPVPADTKQLEPRETKV